VSDRVLQLREVFCVHRTAQGDAAALQGLDLDLEQHEVICVLGPSGAGKTTLLRVIAGLQLPSAGSVRLLGRDIGRMGGRERAALRHQHLGFLGQSSREVLAPWLTAEQAVALPLALRGVGRRRRAVRTEELLEAVGLRARARALPRELSGGERQRVALCVALAHAPTLLLADEPTGELDRASAGTAHELIVSLVRSTGAGAIIASHDPLAAAHAERTIGLRDGRIVEERSADATRLVIGRGGWVRLPTALQAAAGLGDRVEPRPLEGGLLLAPVAGCEESRTAAAEVPDPVVDGEASNVEPAPVELAGVTRAYRQGAAERIVLDDLTHTFAPGRLTVVTGPSGSGKTTLLRLIAGLDRPDRGEITINGWPLRGRGGDALAELRRGRIGVLAQDPVPVGFLSAHENIMLGLRLRGWDPHAAARRAASVLAAVGLSERASQRATRLSAGELQRLALARALAGARGLLLVDEPTSRLDAANAEMVAALLFAAAAIEGQTVICASHDPAVVNRGDEVLALDCAQYAITRSQTIKAPPTRRLAGPRHSQQ
jgi:ABC-type lipoprotein export system ATPase subunit